MSTRVINVVIDERTNLEDDNPFQVKRDTLMRQALRFSAYNSAKNIYKDYLESSEVFYVDTDV